MHNCNMRDIVSREGLRGSADDVPARDDYKGRKSTGSLKQTPKRALGSINRFVNKGVKFFGFETLGDLGRAALIRTIEIAIPIAINTIVNAVTNKSSSGKSRSRSNTYYPDHNENNTEKGVSTFSTDDVDVVTSEYPSERSSPREHNVGPHTVPDYTRKDGTEVSGYPRGGENGYSRGGNKNGS